MNTIYGQDICDYGAGKLRNSGDGFGGRKAVAALRKGFSRFLRFAAALLLVVVGVNGVWGQTPDFSGTYYIASKGYDGNPNNTDNYYLCPTEGWIYYKATDSWDTNGSTYPNPFLTTYQCKKNTYHSGDPSNAVWIVEKHPTEDYYYIKHKSDGKYLVSNGKISGSTNANRMRVHIETVAQADLDEKALFSIKTYSIQDNGTSPYLIISPKSSAGWNGEYKWYSVNNGNQPYYDKGNTKTDGPGGRATGGIIGLYSEIDINAQFFFEDVTTRPTITYNNTSNQIEITAVQTGTVTIKYTTDGTAPSADNGETYSAHFTPAEGVTTIKAVAIVGNEVSNVATFTIKKYLIQSQNNAWNTTDFHFYMIPGDNNKVNTTSLFRPSMEWTFQSASVENGIQYYYIINNAYSKYLCYDSTNKVYMDVFGSGGNKFKFFMKESSSFPGTYNIIPYGQKLLITKNNGNNSADIINTSANSIANVILENTRWRFILPTDLNTDAPFTVSNTSVAKYYQIANVGSSGYYIVPPTGSNTNATTSNSTTDADVKRGSWYFEEAQAATVSDWCTYYHIRNAETGKYLYFTKDANDAGACLEMKDAIESGNEERYKFTWARTATENTYYIIPKLVKDASQNQFSTLRIDNETLKSNLTRGAENYAWTFEVAHLFCNNPVFEESEGNITITCNTNGAEIHYTIDGSDPTGSSTLYTATTNLSLPVEGNMVIKAIATISDGATPTPNTISSAVATMLYKPDITLSQDTYTYNGGDNNPTVTAISITTTQGTTTADASAYSAPTYSADVTNVGTPTVTITDADATDTWYIWNASTTFTIERKEVTITADDASKTYNGTVLTADGFTAGALETGDTHEFTVAMTAESTITNVGTQPNVIATVDGTAVTTGTATAVGNYLVTTANGELTVNPKAVTITANDNSKVYDGAALTESGFTATDLEAGDTHTFIVEMTAGSTITNVGTQPNVIATVDGVAISTGTETEVGNYLVTTADGELEVTTKTVTITAKDASKPYDSAALTEAGFTTSGLETGDTHEFTVTMTAGSTITNVGTQNNVIATVDGVAVETGIETAVGNYLVTTANGELEISAKAVTITANDASKEYDGNALTEAGFTTSDLETGDTHEFTVTMTAESTITNRGDQPNVIATVDGVDVEIGVEIAIGNYLVTTVNGTLSVTGKVITITAGSDEKVYDGTALTNANYSYDETNLEEGDAITSVTVTGSQTVAGSSENIPSAAVIKNNGTDVTANYTVTYVNGTLTVTQMALTITADSDTKEYDGTALTKNTFTNTDLATGDNIESVTMTGSQTDVGTSDNEPTAAVIKSASNEDVTTSYAITFAKGTLTVNAKAVTITANDASKPYDGTELTETDFTTTALGAGDTHTFTVAMTAASTITNVGTQANVIATVDGVEVTTGTEIAIGNYLVTTADGILTISAKSIGTGALASGFTISFDTDNNIILKDGETTLTINNDYTIDDEVTTSESGRYSIRTVRGTGNYGGTADIRNAIVTFTNDGNGGSEYSATFVAESADPNASPDPEKGHELPDGITAYTVTAINGNTVTTQELTYIPEGLPVLLLANTPIGGFQVQDVSGQTLPEGTVSGNLLKEVTDDSKHFDVKTIYLLYKNEFAYNKAGDLAKWKVYLDPTPVSPSRARLVIKWDTESGIDTSFLSPTASQLPEKWYSFDGRRLNGKPTKKGLYIRNSQKVVIK